MKGGYGANSSKVVQVRLGLNIVDWLAKRYPSLPTGVALRTLAEEVIAASHQDGEHDGDTEKADDVLTHRAPTHVNPPW